MKPKIKCNTFCKNIFYIHVVKVPKMAPYNVFSPISSNNFRLRELLTMVTMQCFDKSCPTKISNNLLMVGFNLNNLSTIKKLVTNHVFVGFKNIRLVS